MAVSVRERVAQVVTELKCRGGAANRASRDRSAAAEPVGWVETPASIGELLPAVAVGVEDERVELHLAPIRRPEHEASRKPGLNLWRVAEAELGERILGGGAIAPGDRQVDVLVRARLLPE